MRLPGGGGTPLAAGLDAAATLALGVRRAGGNPVIVLLTDGRANVARSGLGGRALAGEEAVAAARLLRAQALPTLVIDTGARPDGARRLAEAAQARYCPLPHADAGSVSAAVRAATA
ncbi:Magnesium-chelatase 60 kDa subunit [Methylorubrum podarium]|nr:Magnesium-chelatase 60 kDa subunit [Methylorubrum podarium]